MSRIVIQRHDNGEEKLSAGYDRPMGNFFVDRYDEEGEYLGGVGLLGSEPCPTPEDAARFCFLHGATSGTANRVAALLHEHKNLDYPESNVTVDLTKED